VCSFGSKFENGYARRIGSDSTTYAGCALRNAQKQSPSLQGVELKHASYEEEGDYENCIIYCDPPYKGTTSYKTGTFDHDKFWQWCRDMSRENLVYISEYNAPQDFECVWEGEIKTNFASQRNEATHKATEKLFRYKH
jgi:DNA adenine methylase